MTSQCWTALFVIHIWVGGIAGPANALPYALLQRRGASCMSVDVTRGTTLDIGYKAPDLKYVGENAGTKPQKDVHLVIVEKDLELTAAGAASIASVKEVRTRPPQRKIEVLTAKEGSVEFVKGDTNGLVEVCIHSHKATEAAPSRVALNITKHVQELEDRQPRRKMQASEVAQESARLIEKNTNRITVELKRMERRIMEITDNASYAVDQYVQTRDIALGLQKAVKYWPLFRIVMISLSTIVQAVYVVGYMKRKNVI